MAQNTLNDRIDQVYNYIVKCLNEKGYPPSIREICKEVGLSSSSSVHNILLKMEDKNMIKRDKTKPRAITLVEKDEIKGSLNIPIIKDIFSEENFFDEQNILSYIQISNFFLTGGEHFLMKVKGNSMIKAGILDKDFILVKKQEIAENHSIVVAIIEDIITVKTFFKSGVDKIILQPENDILEPKIYKANEIKIIGIVKGVFRKI